MESTNQSTNPLVKDEVKDGVEMIYSIKDQEYITHLQQRLEDAKALKSQPWPQFGGKNYYEWYDENNDVANTVILSDKDKNGVKKSRAGSIENKMKAIISTIMGLNLFAEVFAFNKSNKRELALGTAMEDIIKDTQERDGADGCGWKDKFIKAMHALLGQGTTFIQEEWKTSFCKRKRLKEDYKGEFKGFKGYDEFLELDESRPESTILHGKNVLLGSMNVPYMEQQPYVVVVKYLDYSVAKTVFGKFENWQYVVKGTQPISNGLSLNGQGSTIYNNNWRLTDVEKNNTEILFYEDQPNNEFQIIINGVLMLPIGFPLSEYSADGKYSISKSMCDVFDEYFPYGKPFVRDGSVKHLSDVLDMLLGLFTMKVMKSAMTPYVNTSGKVISNNVLTPGHIAMGFQPDELTPIGVEGQGVTAGEFKMFDLLNGLVENSTMPNLFSGGQTRSGTTATEVAAMQQQANKALIRIITASALMVQRMSEKRLWNILAHWFDPTGKMVILNDNDERVEKNRYRNLNKDANIEGEGFGERRTILTDEELPSSGEIRELEKLDEADSGFPVKRTYIRADKMKVAQRKWYVVVNAAPKESSATNKAEFREMLNNILTLVQMGSKPNQPEIEEKFADMYRTKRSKIFEKAQAPQQQQGAEAGQQIQTPEQNGAASGQSQNNPMIDGGI